MLVAMRGALETAGLNLRTSHTVRRAVNVSVFGVHVAAHALLGEQ